MSTSTQPGWIAVHLGDDFNWWLESTSRTGPSGHIALGVLDPRQVAHLVEILEEYRVHGLRREDIESAFALYVMQSEIAEGRLRLVLSEDQTFDAGGELFALPVVDVEGDGPYVDFLDALASARVKKLNAVHEYLQNCTVAELYEELDALDADRYFHDSTRHCFDDISEIVQWEPAEWDDASES